MNANWVPVFYGSIAEVLVLQETFEANGIPALAPDVEHLDIATLGGSAYTLRMLYFDCRRQRYYAGQEDLESRHETRALRIPAAHSYGQS